MTLKNVLSIPVLSTLSLLAAYLAIINKWSFFNQILSAYFGFVAVMILKKYLYAFAQMNNAL
jgi:multisubunit Na+/H+ antiporter MnhE subunit